MPLIVTQAAFRGWTYRTDRRINTPLSHSQHTTDFFVQINIYDQASFSLPTNHGLFLVRFPISKNSKLITFFPSDNVQHEVQRPSLMNMLRKKQQGEQKRKPMHKSTRTSLCTCFCRSIIGYRSLMVFSRFRTSWACFFFGPECHCGHPSGLQGLEIPHRSTAARRSQTEPQRRKAGGCGDEKKSGD